MYLKKRMKRMMRRMKTMLMQTGTRIQSRRQLAGSRNAVPVCRDSVVDNATEYRDDEDFYLYIATSSCIINTRKDVFSSN